MREVTWKFTLLPVRTQLNPDCPARWHSNITAGCGQLNTTHLPWSYSCNVIRSMMLWLHSPRSWFCLCSSSLIRHCFSSCRFSSSSCFSMTARKSKEKHTGWEETDNQADVGSCKWCTWTQMQNIKCVGMCRVKHNKSPRCLISTVCLLPFSQGSELYSTAGTQRGARWIMHTNDGQSTGCCLNAVTPCQLLLNLFYCTCDCTKAAKTVQKIPYTVSSLNAGWAPVHISLCGASRI